MAPSMSDRMLTTLDASPLHPQQLAYRTTQSVSVVHALMGIIVRSNSAQREKAQLAMRLGLIRVAQRGQGTGAGQTSVKCAAL